MSNKTEPNVEPAPIVRACATCFFSHEQPNPPPNLGKQRFCMLNPPLVIATQDRNGIAVRSMHVAVADKDWCYQYQNDELVKAQLANRPANVS